MEVLAFAFTGHRPSDLPGGYDWESEPNQKITRAIKRVVWNNIQDKLDTHFFQFYCGGALGVDQMTFDTIHRLKIRGICKLELILAVPFLNQDCKWPKESQAVYQRQKKLADRVAYVDQEKGYEYPNVEIGEYHPMKMHNRNRYMVNCCDILVAVWSGKKPGGTANCVTYAKGRKKNIIYINPKEL